MGQKCARRFPSPPSVSTVPCKIAVRASIGRGRSKSSGFLSFVPLFMTSAAEYLVNMKRHVRMCRKDFPGKLLAQGLGEEFLNGNIKLLGEDDGETRVDVVDLGSSQSDFLVALSVLGLQFHVADSDRKLLDLALVLLDRGSLSFGLDLLRLEFVLELLLQLGGGFESLVKLLGLHLLLTFCLELLVLLFEFLGDLLAFLLNEIFVVLLLPFFVETLGESKPLSALLLLELGLERQHHLLDTVLLILDSINLVLYLLHLSGVSGGDEALPLSRRRFEYDLVRWLESYVLELQRAATNSVSFVIALLVTSTKRELIDKVDGSCALTVSHQLGLEFALIVLANSVDMLLQLSGLFKLLEI
ncbi:DNA topoisomerase 1, partial [Aureobasidium melanogenum]